MRSRTFGQDTNEAHVLEAAIASLGAQAAFRLRRAGLLARRIGVFTNTNRHKPGYRRWAREHVLAMPTHDSGVIISHLIGEMQGIFSTQQQYHRLGVFLYDFVPAASLQTDLLGQVNTDVHDRSTARMQALDQINKRHGKGHIYFAAEDLSKSWQPKHHIRSPRYVSNWDELPEAHLVR
jgi:DNA polymerase V